LRGTGGFPSRSLRRGGPSKEKKNKVLTGGEKETAGGPLDPQGRKKQMLGAEETRDAAPAARERSNASAPAKPKENRC